MFGRVLVGVAVLGAIAIAAVIRSAPAAVVAAPARPASETPVHPGVSHLREEALPPPYEALKPLHLPKRAAGPEDWLVQHPEAGQSYAVWRGDSPVRRTATRGRIYVQPFGAFTVKDEQLIALTCDYLQRFFSVPVVMQDELAPDVIPPLGRRLHPTTGQQQVSTVWVLEYLAERTPEDALAVVALTNEDLFPHPSWNFVFGQASLSERVGVWSFHRFGDPAKSQAAFNLALRRMLATAVHELSHMLSIQHCVAWECVMNGSNSLQEADAAPLEPCPADLAKLCDATSSPPAISSLPLPGDASLDRDVHPARTHCDMVKRFDDLIAFWEANPSSPQTLQYLKRARSAVLATPQAATGHVRSR